MVSTDQAHSLGDVLGIAVPPTGQGDPVRVLAYDPEAGGGFLDALALDTLALLEGRWLHVVETLDRRFPGSELSSIAPEELCALPGIRRCWGCTPSASLRQPDDGIGLWSTAPRRRTPCGC